jgi:hypothetical protein
MRSCAKARGPAPWPCGLSYCSSRNGEPLYRPGLRIRARPATEEERVGYDRACSADDDTEDMVFVYLVELDRE